METHRFCTAKSGVRLPYSPLMELLLIILLILALVGGFALDGLIWILAVILLVVLILRYAGRV